MVHARRLLWLFVLITSSVGSPSSAAVSDDATPAPIPATISGVIVQEGGAPSTTKGWICSEVKQANPDPQDASGEFRNHGSVQDKFSIRVHPGTVWLKYFAEGYAPAWIGPLEVTAGQKVENAKITLQPGVSAGLRIVSTDGKEVEHASVKAYPIIGDSSNGRYISEICDAKGFVRLEHLADVAYELRVNSADHEPLRTGRLILKTNGDNIVTMTRSLPVTGAIFHADGALAKNAKILFRLEVTTDNQKRTATTGYGYGDVIGRTGDDGRFKLDQFTRGSRYLCVIEDANHRRTLTQNLRAGIAGVEIRLPNQQNLRVKLVGDLGQLRQRQGKPLVSIRQPVKLETERQTYSDLIGGDGVVIPTEDGGVVDYTGLVSGVVEVNAGKQQVTANVVENGLTEVTIDLGKDKAK